MKSSAVLALAAIAALLPSAARAQQTPSKSYVLKAARMFDGKSSSVTTPGEVVVTDGKIVGVGAGATIPTGAEVIDLGDATLLPGFIDAHTHLTMMYREDYTKALLNSLQETIPEMAIDGIANARVTLMAGFTTVRDVGSQDYLDVGLRNSIDKGNIPGPRMLICVHAIGATGGHCDDTGFRAGVFGKETGPEEGVVNGADQARYAVRLAHKYGATIIKTCATGGVLSLADSVDTPQLTQAELDALVDEAHALKLKAAAHAHGAEGAKRAIRAGIDSIEHGSFLDDEALDLMKQHGTYYIPTLMATQGLSEQIAKGIPIPPRDSSEGGLGYCFRAPDISESVGEKYQDRIGYGRRGVSARPQRRRISPDGGPGHETGRSVESGNFLRCGFAWSVEQNRHAGNQQAG